MIDVLMLPGTGWPNGGDGVTEDFLDRLDPGRFALRIVPYPAEFGEPGNQTYRKSRDLGAEALRAAIHATPNKVIIGGYSQGAVIAGDVAADIAAGLHPDLEIVACALIADGARPEGAGVPGVMPTVGYGIAGQRPVPSDVFPTYWAAAPGDPITALPAGNPLRSVADIVDWMTINSPEGMIRWGADVLDRVLRGQLQDWWAPWKWQSWLGATAYARGYLFDGRHGAAYITEGYNAQLAAAINSLEV